MDNIVKFSEIPEYVKNTIFAIKHGLYMAENEGGVIADSEMEVQFNMLVVADDGWQVLDVTSNRDSEGSSLDGGSTSTTTSEGAKVSDSETNSDTSSHTDGDVITHGEDKTISIGKTHDKTTTTNSESSVSSSSGSAEKSSNMFSERSQAGVSKNETE